MILVYSDVITNRLTYVLNVLFKYTMGVDYRLTTNREEFKESKISKINYSDKNIDGCVQIVPVNLLFEKEIKEQNIEVERIDKIPFFFKNVNNEYDVLASSFWMLTRYEEYLPFEKDNHGRFSAAHSLGFKEAFLKKPVVNLWGAYLVEKLQEIEPGFKIPDRKVSYLNTLDIDGAYAYKAKGFIRFYGGFIKSFLKKDKEDIDLRFLYLKSRKDPYNTYDYIDEISKKVKTVYFFLLGDKSEYDVNIHHKKRGFKKLIKKISETHQIGIHPSYLSNQDGSRVSKEIKRLEKITHQNIDISRQHFLKLEFPKTYENLISNNITVDYTMGYADQLGFRAGVCNAYPFYNLRSEEERPLWIVPFQVMDGTLNQYLKLNPEEAVTEIKEVMNEVKKVKGLYVSLWHNSSLSEIQNWKGWRCVYEEMLSLMS